MKIRLDSFFQVELQRLVQDQLPVTERQGLSLSLLLGWKRMLERVEE